MNSRFLAWTVVVATLGTCAWPGASAPPAPDDSCGKVYLIGVQHAPGLFLTEGLSPGHVRAALDAIDPEVVGVESNPEWFEDGKHYRFSYEAFAVAAPWAQAKGRRIAGIDWIGDMKGWEGEQRVLRVKEEARLLQSADLDPARFGYGPSRPDHIRRVDDGEIDSFAFLNSLDFAAERIAWLDGEKHVAGTPQAYIAVRDRKITEYIVAAAKGAKSVAVVIGAAHVGNVTRELKARGIDVGDLRAALRAAGAAYDESADSHLAARDIAATLCISLDTGMATQQSRESALLRRLEALEQPQVRDWLQYVQARRAMINGDFDVAKQTFMEIAESNRTTEFPFIGASWRHRLFIQQAAVLELGRLADLAGERDAALQHYSRLLKSIEVPIYSEDEHSDFELLARAANAVRALVQKPYSHDRAFAAERRQAALNPPPAAVNLQTAWDHLRNKRWPQLHDEIKTISPDDLPSFQRLEYHYIAAISAVEGRGLDQARNHLKQLESLSADLPEDHWLMRELPALRLRVIPSP